MSWHNCQVEFCEPRRMGPDPYADLADCAGVLLGGASSSVFVGSSVRHREPSIGAPTMLSLPPRHEERLCCRRQAAVGDPDIDQHFVAGNG